MKKKLLAFLITFGVMIAGTASASLWSFYNGNLPSIAERTPIAQEAGISNYTGTYSQNIALEAYLRGGMEVLGATPTPTSSAAIKYVEAPDFYAYSPAVAGDTTITINNLTDIYGNKLTMADFGNIGYGRIDPDGAEVSESFTFTGVTANSDGTYTLTGVKSVLAKYPYTQTSGLVRSHSINAIVRFTNTAALYDNFANKENDEIIDGSWSFLNNTFSIGDGANTNKTFKFNNGATNTPEMVYDATNNQLKFRRSGETSYTEIPLSLRGTYANYASLPTDASNGDIAITTDDHKLYTYNATGATWVLAGGSSGAGTVYKTVKYGTEADGDDNKTFTLSAGSWPDERFLLVYKNGILMENHADGDYTVIDSNTIEFNYEVEDTDKIVMIVVSVDLYNPDWGLVNASIVPDTDNAYDIGSSSKQFKDLYLKGDLILNDVPATSTPTANAVPITNASGTLSYGWVNNYFGDGSDGDVVATTSSTLTRDMYYNNFTVNTGVVINTGGYRIFVRGTLTNNGTIQRNGNNASGVTGGAALSSGTVFGSVAGGNSGANGTNNISFGSSKGSNGGGSSGYFCGTKSAPTGGVAITEYAYPVSYLIPNIENLSSNNFSIIWGSISTSSLSSAPGSAGGADQSSCTGGAYGGGGGSSGGVVYIAALKLINNGTISSNGGNGASGVVNSNGSGGGGGGGNGGTIIMIYKTLTSGTLTVTGGNGGAAVPYGGEAGENGSTGVIIKVKI